jgi:two-component sensor histidine kinase
LLICLLYGLYCHAQKITNWDAPQYNIIERPIFDINNPNPISKIIGDRKERIWFIAYNKIYRYNGSDYKVYDYPIDSLGRTYLKNIAIDNRGKIWVTANHGLGYYDEANNDFVKIAHFNGKRIGSLDEMLANGDKLYFANDKMGLCHIDIKSLKIEADIKFPEKGIQGICFDKTKSNIYFKTFYKGLGKYNLASKKITYIAKLGINGSKTNFGFMDYFFDNSNRSWLLSSRKGMVPFNKIESMADTLQVLTAETSKNDIAISQALQLNNKFGTDTFVVATNYGGVRLYDCKNNIYSNPIKIKGFKDSMEFISTLYFQTSRNILWIATNKKLYSINFSNQKFSNVPFSISKVGKSYIDVINIPDNSNSTWFLTPNNGLNKFSSITNKIIEDKETLWLKQQVKMFENKCTEGLFYNKHIMFIACKTGLIEINFQNRRADFYKLPKEILFFNYGDIELVGNELLFVANDCIYQFNVITKQFKTLSNLERAYKENNFILGVTKNLLDSNILFMNTFKGCYLYNLSNSKLDTLFFKKDNNILGDNIIRNVNQWKDSIYLQTDNGSYIVDIKSKKYKYLNGNSKPNSLSNISFLDSNRYWVVNNTGAHLYNADQNKFEKFNTKDGLAATGENSTVFKNKFNNNSIIVHKNSFDIINNYNTAEPLSQCNFVSVINQYKDTVSRSYNILTKQVFEPNVLETVLEVEIPYYNSQDDIVYYFNLSNINKDWVTLKNPYITYYSLPHGSYTFNAKALMPNGQFTNIVNYTFQIKAPWYKTWWFYAICLIVLGSIIFSFLKYRINQIKEKEKLKAEFGARLIESELGALRAQMNPHFIFNSLNSINSFIVSNKGDEASNYLADFSSLIRLILDNSKNDKIALSQEIDTLKYYLKLESMRFKDKFTFELVYNDDLPVSIIRVPPMIIQPYIENAIWHGLMNLENKEGNVLITFDLNNEDDLIVIIEDNGIGRVASKQLKSSSLHKNKSYGMLITEERLQLIQEKYGKRSSVTILDLYNSQKEAEGTRVTITISNNP